MIDSTPAAPGRAAVIGLFGALVALRLGVCVIATPRTVVKGVRPDH